MLHLNYTNILKTGIGSKHGISDKALRNFCIKNNPYVKDVMRSKKKGGYDFLNLPDNTSLLAKIKRLANEQSKNEWQNIVVLGIGGSSLGLSALKSALLGPLSQKPRLIVIDNIDPDYTEGILSRINISKTLFIVISKSGTTVEPMFLYGIVKQMLVAKNPKNYKKHFIFITDPKKGLLRKIGKEEGITMFDIPPKIGGRFSVLSSVGLVPASLAGIDIASLLKGAKTMREALKSSLPETNPALILASVQFLMDRKKSKNMTVVMPYSTSLFKVGLWYRQLLAESIGKNKKTGPTPLSALGTTDQHSMLQLFAEGPNDKLIIFMRVLKHMSDPSLNEVLPKEIGFLNNKKMSQIIDASYLGTSESLAKANRPNVTIEIPKVDARHIGMLLMLFEFQVALLGLMYKVDTFNQPGVEEGKIITKELLSNS
ncbi:glucose-6-phosphate isomerase [Candidatus Peregrinibacteria bacterium]|nr:glucose-6-phosphate isomerase [Candidatus Peregrinibacteria bacterium]